jgi:hypothetical protein
VFSELLQHRHLQRGRLWPYPIECDRRDSGSDTARREGIRYVHPDGFLYVINRKTPGEGWPKHVELSVCSGPWLSLLRVQLSPRFRRETVRLGIELRDIGCHKNFLRRWGYQIP